MSKVQADINKGIVLSDMNGTRPRIGLTRTGQVMSWLRPGYASAGSTYLSATSGAPGGVIEVVAREVPYTYGKRERRVMLELTRDQAIALRDFLVEQVK